MIFTIFLTDLRLDIQFDFVSLLLGSVSQSKARIFGLKGTRIHSYAKKDTNWQKEEILMAIFGCLNFHSNQENQAEI